MSLTFNTKTYNADQHGDNIVRYNGPAKSISVKDDLSLTRSPAKPTSTFSGVVKTSFKLTRTLTLTGALTPTGDAILQINMSLPVGSAGADQDALLNDAGAFLSGADAKTMAKTPKINF